VTTDSFTDALDWPGTTAAPCASGSDGGTYSNGNPRSPSRARTRARTGEGALGASSAGGLPELVRQRQSHVCPRRPPDTSPVLIDLDAIEGYVRVSQNEPDLGQGVCLSADGVMTPSLRSGRSPPT